MTREDEIEIARRFAEWIEYTASSYLTEENDVLSVIERVLSKADEEEGYDIAKEILKGIDNNTFSGRESVALKLAICLIDNDYKKSIKYARMLEKY